MIVDDDLDVFGRVEDGARGIVTRRRRLRIHVQDLTISFVFEEEARSILRDHYKRDCIITRAGGEIYSTAPFTNVFVTIWSYVVGVETLW